MSDAENKAPKGPRWGKIVLILSLSVNLLIAGLAVGTFANVKKGDNFVRNGEESGAYTFALSPKDRREIGKNMASYFQKNGRDRDALGKEYARMIEVVTADTFDREAAQLILSNQASFAVDRRLAAEGLLLDQLESMSADERREFAERLQEGVKRRRGPPRPRN
ncbi:MAG: periplasmic heavy metal sensor [Paracoccaceae bacterium]|nr:periplasmic heavy metal sensor [Paracoccaceae bacterium]MDG1737557.1 periplasmic heavy metal sensor [Paracoccaceae bacterium]MDG2257473.1 periplasmic heavy metal sensor [Paracoccaceae bacterium]